MSAHFATKTIVAKGRRTTMAAQDLFQRPPDVFTENSPYNLVCGWLYVNNLNYYS